MSGLLVAVPRAETLPSGVDQHTATLGLLYEKALLSGWQAFQEQARDLGVPRAGGALFYRFPPTRRMVVLDPNSMDVKTDARVCVAGFVEQCDIDTVKGALGYLVGTDGVASSYLDSRERAWRVVEAKTTHYAVAADFFDTDYNHVSTPMTISRPELPSTDELRSRINDSGFDEAMRQVPLRADVVNRELGRAILCVGQAMPPYVA